MKKYRGQPLLCLVFTVVFIVTFHIVGQAHDVSMDAGAGFTSFNFPPDKMFVSYAGVTASLEGDTMSGYQVYAVIDGKEKDEHISGFTGSAFCEAWCFGDIVSEDAPAPGHSEYGFISGYLPFENGVILHSINSRDRTISHGGGGE